VKPDLSFIIAAFNAESSIKRAINSALAQEDVTVEVVVVDDQSTDHTARQARSIDPERVRVVSTGSNRGPGGARNVGFGLARGRWIAVLDSDDSVRPDRSARMIARAERANAQIVVDNLEVAREGESSAESMFVPDELASHPILTLREMIAANLLFKSTFNYGYMKPMFERRFLSAHNLQYDETLRIGEDYVFLASALASGGKCVIEPSAGYIYHVREGSISRVLEHKHVAAMLAADARFIRRFELAGDEIRAQRCRTRSLNEAAAFLSIVESLKRRSITTALKTAIGNPRAVRLLSMPLGTRLKRLVRFRTERRP
jgi:succinoglycan biosynthesis protein ExoO